MDNLALSNVGALASDHKRVVIPSSLDRDFVVADYAAPLPYIYDHFKRLGDLTVTAILLALLAPVMLAVALLIRLTSPGPVIYRQRRLTLGGKVFTMYKFRTMTYNAERAGVTWTTISDPRITLLGRVLRKTRLDELPQFFNVLNGDMSLIGPRPERPEFAHELSRRLPNFHRRLEVRAGISGLAQVHSGYASCLRSYRKKLALDLLYVKNRSLLLDLKIAAMTILTILTGKGAR